MKRLKLNNNGKEILSIVNELDELHANLENLTGNTLEQLIYNINYVSIKMHTLAVDAMNILNERKVKNNPVIESAIRFLNEHGIRIPGVNNGEVFELISEGDITEEHVFEKICNAYMDYITSAEYISNSDRDYINAFLTQYSSDFGRCIIDFNDVLNDEPENITCESKKEYPVLEKAINFLNEHKINVPYITERIVIEDIKNNIVTEDDMLKEISVLYTGILNESNQLSAQDIKYLNEFINKYGLSKMSEEINSSCNEFADKNPTGDTYNQMDYECKSEKADINSLVDLLEGFLENYELNEAKKRNTDALKYSEQDQTRKFEKNNDFFNKNTQSLSLEDILKYIDMNRMSNSEYINTNESLDIHDCINRIFSQNLNQEDFEQFENTFPRRGSAKIDFDDFFKIYKS